MHPEFLYLVNSLFKAMLEIFVWDRRLRRVLKGKFCRFVLKRYVDAVELEGAVLSDNADKKYRIWQYWDKGYDNAPDLVKACLASVERYKGDFERVLLDENSIKEYVKIPDYIYALKSKGLITPAHFSDILRTYLLYEYGGCWIDATVYMTAPMPEFIRFSELFVFQNNKDEDLDGLNMTNYFISSKGNSVIIAKMKKFLDKYWMENKKAINYFFYAHAFTLFTESSDENIREWNEMFKFPYPVVQLMEKELLDKYSPKRLRELESMSAVHKLSYKRKVIAGRKELRLADTLYEHIIDKYLEPSEYKGLQEKQRFKFLQLLKSRIGFYFSLQDIDDHYVLKIFGAKVCIKHKTEPPAVQVCGIREHKRKRRLIVSLTTYPARIHLVHKTIETLLNQTVKPDEIVLWLAREQFSSLPDGLTELEKFGLKIKWCGDIKSYKKLIPSLIEYPDDIIVTVDDDYYYDTRLLEELYNEYLKNPKCIHARQAFLVKKAGQKELCLQARNYIYDKSYLPSYLNEPVGCGGVLYPPASLHKNVLNAEQFMKEVPTHDDLWFWGHAVRNGTPISVIPNGYKLKNIVIEGSQSDSLWHKNMVNSTENVGMTGKEALNKICTLFPEISCRLGLFKK